MRLDATKEASASSAEDIARRTYGNGIVKSIVMNLCHATLWNSS